MHDAALPDVAAMLPHGREAVLLDRLLAVDADHARAEVTVAARPPFVDGDRVDATLMLEYMAQAIAACFGFTCRGRGEPIRVGYLVGVREATFHTDELAPGSRLTVVARRVFGDRALAAFECSVDDGDAPLATAVLAVVLPELGAAGGGE